ncbi:MAG: magnesium/cobalt efflux protein, partial [Roseobacter sp.]|nr:magnesium/cobalt efflux protein [Roseobacter sp.]
MGDNDGSSDAARSAREQISPPQQPEEARQSGFFSRVFEALSPSDQTDQRPEFEKANDRPQTHGMINLRRMRVEDVMVPKADITAVPDSTSLNEAVA